MMNREYDQKIVAWMDEHREKIIQDWIELSKIPSIRSEALPGAPFGAACAEALHKAAELCAERGFTVRVNDEGGYALAECGDGEKTIGLFGHTDVVPVGDGWIYTEPFEPVIVEGSLIGRGVSDNGSGVMISMCVMELLRDCGIPLRSRLQAFLGSNEESGMEDINVFVKNEKMPELSFIPDSGFSCSLGEKGIFRLWNECRKPLQAVRSCRGGEAFNIVLDAVEMILEPNAELEVELRGKMEEAEGYSLSVLEDGALCLKTKGIAKHASSPEGSRNALLMAAGILVECATLNANDREIMQSLCKLLQSPYGEGMGIAHEDVHFGKLTSVNGMVEMREKFLRVSLDIRYGASLSAEKVEEKTRAAWDAHGWTMKIWSNRAGFETDPASKVPEVMTAVYRDVTGLEAKPFYMSGGTYSRYLKNAFAIGTAAGVAERKAPKLELPAGHGGAHQCDERADLEEFFQAMRVVAHAIIACDAEL